MYAVKMPQASRYVPTIGRMADAGFTCATNTELSSQKLIQKAPKLENAVAANVLPRRKAHIPARSCAPPPNGMASAKTTGVAPGAIQPALIADRTSVVMPNAARPSGAGSATRLTSAVAEGPINVCVCAPGGP